MAQPSRRSVLGLFGATSVAGGAALIAGRTAIADTGLADTSRDGAGRIPPGLRPGGELDRLIADKAAKDEFSGSVLLTHRGRTVLARSHGLADRQRAVPNGPDTMFGLASVTKLFTAVAIAQLVQQGKVSYGEKLGAYVDGFPAPIANGATVHHLLTHTSGFGDFHQLPGYLNAVPGWNTPAEVMSGTTDFIRKSEPAFPAGAGWLYSNSAYHLLGEIIAKASGMSYYDYVRRHVFAAAGMTSTGFFTKPEWRANRRMAHPYRRDPKGLWTDTLGQFAYIGLPAGGASATCADMDRFARALWNAKLLDRGQTELVLSGKQPMPTQGPPPGQAANPSPDTPPAGGSRMTAFQCYGPIGKLADGKWSFEFGGGNTNGHATAIQFFPQDDWVVVVLSNYANAAVQPIVATASRLILAK
ncbi:serine hydrolase domain-containing protein [Kribbella sp. NPDC023855]|uniref:serine hydrolase domain-containing protein n=1 Tax=Kribbella sp. NPDC023855 TaxID=3154698 RepID=UPI0033F24C1C